MCKNCGYLLCFGCKKTEPAPPSSQNHSPQVSQEELDRIREQGRKAVEDGEKYMNAWGKIGNLGKKGF